MITSGSANLPIVAIVGRPNVGKSALFNRIVGRRVSIVHEQAGVTRDRVAAPTSFEGCHFTLVDTGGLGIGIREKHVDVFDGLIRDQVAEIVRDAEALIWVVDCQAGVTPQDQEVSEFLRQSGKPVIVAANKADNDDLRNGAMAAFAELGFDKLAPTSCTHNFGVDDLVRAVLPSLPRVEPPLNARGGLKVAVVGRPNVGKSSIINHILGEDRVMVSDIAGTTRDAIDVPLTVRDRNEDVPLTLIDTAGLRRRRQVDTVVEFFSAARAQKAIRRADLVLMVVDAADPGTAQDRRIARMINDERKPCILLVNKWDLVSGSMKKGDLVKLVRSMIPFMQHAPIHLISALKGFNFDGIFDHLFAVRDQMQIAIPTSVLNQFLQDILARTPPAATGGKRFKIYYATMTGNPPPSFAIFANDRKACPANYLSFLENQIREAFFPEAGLPIRLDIRERASADPEHRDGTRRAAAGANRRKNAEKAAGERHKNRRKGWRQK